MKNVIIRTIKWFQENHSLVLTFATVALAIITLFYLLETRSIRRITERTFLLDTNPKVFLQEIIPKARLNEAAKSIEVSLIFKIKNAGKTEAMEVAVDYQIQSKETDNQKSKTVTIDGTVGPVQYLFPSQEFVQETKMVVVKLSDTNFEVVKEAMQQKKPIIVPKDLYPPISCNLQLSYLDQSGGKVSYPYNYEYLFHENKLVYKK